MATLSTNVHVTDADGVSHVFGPADEVPAWAEALITNPKAWTEPPEPRQSTDGAKKAQVRRPRKAVANGPVHAD